ncbi:MAG: phasin family protein [Betaproteobacteria bacterium]|nr:MAG: phasin family protein [Betaproteobacteria bacterium]
MLSLSRARASLRNEFKDTKGVPMIQQQQTYFLELYRAGLRAASDIAKASIENAQRLHAQQVDALRQALDTNGDSARRLSEASSLTDLLALQVKLAGMQTEQAAEFWTRAWRTAGETQVAMLGQVNSQVGQLSDRMRETYSAATRVVENAVNNGAEAEQRRSA